MPLRGASGSSVHFAGMHFGTLLHVPLLQTWLGFEEKSVDFVQRKENNAFCTLPDWPGVANLIITSLLVRDWFRTRTRQILGVNLKQRTGVCQKNAHMFLIVFIVKTKNAHRCLVGGGLELCKALHMDCLVVTCVIVINTSSSSSSSSSS